MRYFDKDVVLQKYYEDERRERRKAIAVVIMVFAVIGLALLFIFSVPLHAEPLKPIKIQMACDGDTCVVSRKQIEFILQHNNAVTIELEKRKACAPAKNET